MSIVEDLVTDLIYCLVSTYWSGCGVWRLVWYLAWWLVSDLVSGHYWCLVLVSGYWFWSGVYCLLVLIWCVMSGLISSCCSGVMSGIWLLVWCGLWSDLVSGLLSYLVSNCWI